MNNAFLRRFINDQCSKEEEEIFFEWLLNPDNSAQANEFLEEHWKQLSNTSIEDVPQFDQNKNLEAVLQKVKGKESKKSGESIYLNPDSNKESHPKLYWAKIAALIILSIGAIFFLYRNNGSIGGDTITYTQKHNPRGTKSTFLLADGTTVTLNAESSVKYGSNYNESDRVIFLQGEAHFEVAKDKSRPFKVVTGGTTTTALGTSFNVSAFRDSELRISLLSGKVMVENKSSGESFILNPGEEVYRSALASDEMLKRGFSKEYILGWSNNTIYLDSTDLFTTFKMLERWYDIEIETTAPKQALKSLHGTGQFKNQSLEEVLTVLSYTMKFDFSIANKKVIVTF